MTIKQHGGVFGRNPSFNDISVETLSIAGTALSSTATELNILDGVTADATELNYLDGASTSAVVASKAVVANSSGNIAFPNGKGIDFSATSDAAGSTSELFGDYEEGTFTPVYIGSSTAGDHTHTTQAGFYEKLGRLVNFRIRCTISSKGTIAGNISIGGLPYTSASTASSYGQAFSSLGVNLSITAGTSVTGVVELNSDEIGLRVWSEATGTTNFTDSNMTNTTQIFISGNYFAA